MHFNYYILFVPCHMFYYYHGYFYYFFEYAVEDPHLSSNKEILHLLSHFPSHIVFSANIICGIRMILVLTFVFMDLTEEALHHQIQYHHHHLDTTTSTLPNSTPLNLVSWVS